MADNGEVDTNLTDSNEKAAEVTKNVSTEDTVKDSIEKGDNTDIAAQETVEGVDEQKVNVSIVSTAEQLQNVDGESILKKEQENGMGNNEAAGTTEENQEVTKHGTVDSGDVEVSKSEQADENIERTDFSKPEEAQSAPEVSNTEPSEEKNDSSDVSKPEEAQPAPEVSNTEPSEEKNDSNDVSKPEEAQPAPEVSNTEPSEEKNDSSDVSKPKEPQPATEVNKSESSDEQADSNEEPKQEEPQSATDKVRSEKSLESKFNKLRDLMATGSISNKEVHDNVLSLLVGGGDFDFDRNFIIESPESISQLLKTMDVAGDELKAELWSFFVAVLKRSGRSLQACAEIGLIEMALSRLPSSTTVVADLIVELLCILATYNISERELKMLFAYLKETKDKRKETGKVSKSGSWKPHATKLLRVFRAMPNRSGPDEFFSFSGTSGSAIVLPPIAKFPLQTGWTFSAWVRLDPPAGTSFDDRERPYLFSFMTSKCLGYTAHFYGNTLVFTTVKVKGKGFQHAFNYQFQARRWHHIAMVFTYSRWTRNEVKLIVDGELVQSADMVWALANGASDAFDRCMIGANSDLAESSFLCGQMTSIYLFHEALQPQYISALHKLGVSYCGQFRQESETSAALLESERKIVYDGRLTHALVFLYTPALCDGQLCLEASPRQVVSGQIQANPHFVSIPHAMLRGGVKSVRTHSVFAALHSLGGIQCFYLLFNQLDLLHHDNNGQMSADYTVCHELIHIVCLLLKNSATIQNQMAQTRGLLIFANLLERSNPKHLTHNLLNTLLQLSDFLANPPGTAPVSIIACHTLLKHLFDYIFWNPQLWIHADVSVQLQLFSFMCETKLLDNGILYNPVRRCSAIMQVLHSLKFYYWIVPPGDNSARSLESPLRPKAAEIKQIRELMLYHIKALVSPRRRSRSHSSWSIGGQGQEAPRLHSTSSVSHDEEDSIAQKSDNETGDGNDTDNSRRNSQESIDLDDDADQDDEAQAKSLSKQHVTKTGIVDDEFQAILNYLSTIHEDENLQDVLRLCISLMAEQPATMVPTFDRRQGIRVVFKLLASPDIDIRLLSLKLLGYFLCRSVYQRKADVLSPNNLFMLIVDRLLMHTDRIDMRTYNVLLELMTERILPDSLGEKHPIIEHNHSIENPMLFKVIASLISQSKPSFSVTDVKRQFIADLTVFTRTSKYNRRVILQMSVWQEWLFSMAYLSPESKEEQAVTDSVLELFRVLLHHAVKYEFGGWRVWIDTMSILHSKISLHEWKAMALQVYSGKQPPDESSSVNESGGERQESESETKQEDEEKSPEENVTVEENKPEETVETPTEDPKESADEKGQFSPPSGTYKLAPFRIPDFKWSELHKKLLNELLSSFESDVSELFGQEQSLYAVVNSNENQIFVVNMIHVISQLSDMIVSGCGGLLPVLAAATSATQGSVDSAEPEQGLTVDESVSVLERLVALADVFILGSNICLTDLENEKNMAQGATLRQLLRMVACHSVAVVLGNKREQDSNSENSGSGRCLAVLSTAHLLHQPNPPLTYLDAKGQKQTDPIDSLLANLASAHSRGGEALFDGSRLLQEIDVARLRAILFRDIEETKQAQFLSMSLIYLTSVLMVSRYRDILEPTGGSTATTPSTPKPQNGEEASNGHEVKQSEASERDESVASSEEPAADQKSSDVEKEEQSAEESQDLEETDMATPTASSPLPTSKSPQPMSTADTAATGIAAISLDLSHVQMPQANAASTTAPLIRIDLANISMEKALTLGERLERALGPIAPLIKEIFHDFAIYLSKTLTGSHGQELVSPGGTTIRQAMSVIELVMLFCSQEWQNALQKFGGLSFIELINEGRLYSHAARDHTVRVANEAEFILNRMRAEDVQRHAEFEGMCAQWNSDRIDDEKLCDHLITSARLRDRAHAVRIVDKIYTVMTSKPGAWFDDYSRQQFWKLDFWEDDSRRRQRFQRNPIGSTHPEATLTSENFQLPLRHSKSTDEAALMELYRKLKSTHSLTSSQQAPQTGDFTDEELLQASINAENDLALSEADRQQPDGPVALMTSAKLVVPGVTINGTLSVTKTDVYFEMDPEDAENRNIDPGVLAYAEGVHGRWAFSEIRAIFSRRYLLQNVAIEVFLSNRTAVFFAFADRATVKKVINVLPRVGVGVKYGLPQTRRSSLATPRQLFKLSGMTARWQRREISNFDYLMFLNTIAGRSYCDLSQYPVFPWVISNYESQELDLNVPSNYRDLSKPIGALNPQRKAHFEERYSQWDHDSVPPFHYGSHYSTSTFTLNWLLRVEPFASGFIALQGGHFDHPDRMFHSVPTAWKNCQRDTADVKEVIPEFYYLPEMFINCNGLKLGEMEGKSIGDVEMPPWAKSADDFVRICRMALESEFVSCQLHQWIDLIFGYKQRGPEAIRSTNVFYYLTYEGAVDVESIKDVGIKEGTLNQIKSFGITPNQLLNEPHPTRSSAMHVMLERNKSQNWPVQIPMTAKSDLCMILKFATNSAVCYTAANTQPVSPVPAVLTILANKTFAINKWITPQQAVQAQQSQVQHLAQNKQQSSTQSTPSSTDSQASAESSQLAANASNQGNAAASNSQQSPQDKQNSAQSELVYLPLQMDPFVYGYINMNRRTLVDNFDERVKFENRHFVVSADNKYILACAFWDKSFRVYLSDTAKLTQVVYGHCDLVTCIARSECSVVQDCYVATGSRDCTVLLWHWSNKHHAIIGDSQMVANAITDRPAPKAVLTGHLSAVTCLAVSAELGLVFSGSKDGSVLIHTTLGDLLHSLDPPRPGLTPNHVCVSRDGRLFVAFDKSIIVAFSINGRPITAIDISDHVRAMFTTRDGRFLFVGTESGLVHIWQAETLTLLYTYPRCDSGVRSLSLSHDQRFILSGMSNGSLVVFNVDLNKWNLEMGGRFS